MSGFVKTRLGIMMFLQYVIWGSWYVTLNTYLTTTLHFSGTQAGAAFGTVSVACLVSPFFVGLVADRFFSTERVMAALYALGAIFMILLSRATSFPGVPTRTWKPSSTSVPSVLQVFFAWAAAKPAETR